MNKETIQFSAQIDSCKANNDRTLTLKLDTQELSSDDTAKIFALFQTQIWVALAETEVKSLDIPEILPDIKGEKSPSEQMKAIIYRIWEQRTDKTQPFPDFYKSYMFKLCENLKEKLN